MRIAWVALAALAFGCSKPKKPPASEKPDNAPANETPPTAEKATPPAMPAASDEPADKFAAAEKRATSDLVSIAASAHVPGLWRTSLWWDGRRKATMADARLLFAADAGDPLAEAPYLTADRFQVDIGPPPRIVTHADPDKLRKAAELVPRIEQALSLARTDLRVLDRYRSWQSHKWRYETRISILTANGHVVVTFDTPTVTDNDVRIEVDPVAKSVVRRDIHME